MSRGGGPVSTATGTLSRNALYIGGGWRSPSGTAGIEIAQEEIFGPVLAVIPVDDVDDAVRVANDSDYGLSGAVWAGDPAGAVAVAARSRTGQVSVQLPVDAAGTTTVPTAP